jgi:MFS family permease
LAKPHKIVNIENKRLVKTTMPNISTIVSEYMPVKRKAFLTGLAGCGFMLGISCGGVLSAYWLRLNQYL